jgi:hypothetical protein
VVTLEDSSKVLVRQCNTLNKISFESKWKILITQYSEIEQYLTNTLYNTKEAWVHLQIC